MRTVFWLRVCKAILLYLITAMPCMAQPGYFRGSVRLANGDSLQGWIYFNPADRPVGQINLRSGKNEKVIPADSVRWFDISNVGRFEAWTVPVSQVNLTPSGRRYWTDITIQKVFLQKVAAGKKLSLYRLGQLCYYLKDSAAHADSGFDELIYRDFGDCCIQETYLRQLSAYVPEGDPYRETIEETGYNVQQLKKVVRHLDPTAAGKTRSGDRQLHLFLGAGIQYTKLSAGDEQPERFTSKAAPVIRGGIYWQSEGRYERFLNRLDAGFTAFTTEYSGGFRQRFDLPVNTHSVYQLMPKMSILYRALSKFGYTLYAGPGAAICETFITSHLVTKPVDIDYFRKYMNGTSLAFSAEALIQLQHIAIALSYQPCKSTDISANGYAIIHRNMSIMLFCRW